MSNPKSAKNRDRQSAEASDKQLVDSLLLTTNGKFEVWKYFEERAERLGEQLWSTGTWLMSLLAATLSLPFVAGFIKFPDAGFQIKVVARIPVMFIAAFGIALCLYSYTALRDLRKHIEDSWQRAGYARTDKWTSASWDGRKRHGWNLLLGIGISIFVAFVLIILLTLACVP